MTSVSRFAGCPNANLRGLLACVVGIWAFSAECARAAEEKPAKTPPVKVHAIRPEYPEELEGTGISGSVMVEMVIDKQGHVRDPFVIESNNPWFERPVLESILLWRYRPAQENGKPVDSRVTQRVTMEYPGGGNKLWKISKPKNHASLPPEFRWETPPEPVTSAFPVYPFEQLKSGKKGAATIRFVVGLTGRIEAIDVIEATAPEFAAAAVAAIDVWRFKPAQRDNRPCMASIETSYRFDSSDRNGVPVSHGARRMLDTLENRPLSITQADSLDKPLKPVSRRPPIFPSTLARNGTAGEAEIEFYIDASGDAQLPSVVSATSPEFGYAAAQAVASWRFEPPRKDDKPVTVRVRVPIGFKPPPSKSESKI